MTINFRGHIFNDAGTAVSGASVKLLETGTTTQEGSTATSDSAGLWYFNEADQDRYDVEITRDGSVRRIRWDAQISLKEVDVRNNTGNTTPAATFTNLTNNASNQAAVFRSDRGTDNAADGDEVYLSFNLRNDNNEEHEFARLTAEAVDVSNGSEDGQFRFGVSVSDGTITDVFTINSSTGGAATISYEVDSFTIKGGEGEAGVLYLFADQGDDAGDEWKVNIADGGVMPFGNDIASAGSYVSMLTITPHATTASSSVAIAGDATVGDDLSLTSDSSVFNMGAGNDFTITHDGTTGATLAGTPITVNSTGALTLDSSTDITLDADGADVFLKDGGTLFGTLTNSSGELVIKSSSSGTTAATFSGANVTLAGTVGSGAITSTGTIQGTTITATTAFVPDASDGAALGTTSLEFSDLYLADGAVVGFGDDQEVTLTHVHDAGLLLSSTDKLQFGASGTFIHQSSDGVLTITSDTTVDINGAVAFDGAITGATDITLSGELDAATLDISGNADIDGTTNLDAVDIDGAVQLDATLTIGADDQGYDIIFYGDAASANVTWDTSVDDLIFNGAARIVVPDGQLVLGSTAVSSTAAELNLLDGVSGLVQADLTKLAAVDATAAELNLLDGSAKSTSSITLADADAFVVIDGTTTKQIPASDIKTYAGGATAADDIGTGDGAVSIVTTSGNITIDAQANDTDVIIKVDDAGSSVTAVTFDGSDEGNAIFVNDVQLKSDGALLEFGADLDTTLTHSDGAGLTLNSTNKLMFNDASQFVQGSSATVLSIGATDEIDLTATAVDLNGTLDCSGSATFSGNEIQNGTDGAFVINARRASGVSNLQFQDEGTLRAYMSRGGAWVIGSGDTNTLGTTKLTVEQASNPAAAFNRITDTGNITRYYQAGTLRGQSNWDGSTFTIGATSDYRLKENDVALSGGLTKINQLRPIMFNWRDNASVTRSGFFAHEVQAIIPEAVVGIRDATVVETYIDGDGNTATRTVIDPQSLDESKIVPTLVAAVKELSARVTVLEG